MVRRRPSPPAGGRSERVEEAVLRARATAYKQIPARGTTVHGEAVTGLPGTVLEPNAIGQTELGPNAVLNANIGEQIAAGKLPNIGGLQGDLPDNKLPNVPKSKLPGDIQYGRPKASELDYGAGRPIPAGKVSEGYDYKDLKDPPKLGKYVTKNELQNELKKYQKKGGS